MIARDQIERIENMPFSDTALDVMDPVTWATPPWLDNSSDPDLGPGDIPVTVTQAGGKGGLLLWPLFGTTNQLVAGVTLLVVSVWLRRLGRPYLYTLVPMLLVAAATLTAMAGELRGYFANFEERWLLAIMGTIILAADVWVLLEGGRILLGERREPATAR